MRPVKHDWETRCGADCGSLWCAPLYKAAASAARWLVDRTPILNLCAHAKICQLKGGSPLSPAPSASPVVQTDPLLMFKLDCCCRCACEMWRACTAWPHARFVQADWLLMFRLGCCRRCACGMLRACTAWPPGRFD